MDALGFGGTVKALGIRAKQQHGGIGRLAVFEQIQMGEQCLRCGVGLERKAAFTAGGFQKPINALAREVLQGGAVTSGSIKRRDAQSPHAVEVVNEAGVDFGAQGAEVFDSAADQFSRWPC